MKRAGILIACACAVWAAAAPALADPPPPGVVIHHAKASSGLYIGSPSLCVLEDGTYLASHDEFGPKSGEHRRARGRIYQSADRGAVWRQLAELDGFFWTSLFEHRGAVYALGTDRHHGRLVMRRSDDGGRTWTHPATAETGLLAEGRWHTAPVPVVEHDGRLWRAVEDADGGSKWGERYRARMLSAPLDADLLQAGSWTISNPVARDPKWQGGAFGGWLEGNAVVTPDGEIANILRVELEAVPEQAAVVNVSADGKTARFDPATGFVEFPGGAKKFTIRKDPAGPGYWSLSNVIPERRARAGRPGGIRNTLALVHSADLRAWQVRCILLDHPDVARHAFQYADWRFDGDDLIAVCRTAWDDAEGGAHNAHDANFLTFHRWKNFRALTRDDDVPLDPADEPPAGNPLMRGADPHAEWIDGACWIYATGLRPAGGQLFAAASPELEHWTVHGPVLDLDGIPWVRADGRLRAGAWAPCIARRDGRWFFYYSVGPQSAAFPSRIGVAVGSSPAGPFEDSGQPLLTGGDGFEAIDPMVFEDPESGQWLLYAGGSAGAKLRVFELDADMISFAREIPVDTPPRFTEGAFMHRHEGVYHLTYSHGRWQYGDYSVHHASAPSPVGPWTYRGPILTSDEGHKGPGHHSIVRRPDTGEWLIFYHRWQNAGGDGPYSGPRQIAVQRLVHLAGGGIAPVKMTD